MRRCILAIALVLGACTAAPPPPPAPSGEVVRQHLGAFIGASDSYAAERFRPQFDALQPGMSQQDIAGRLAEFQHTESPTAWRYTFRDAPEAPAQVFTLEFADGKLRAKSVALPPATAPATAPATQPVVP